MFRTLMILLLCGLPLGFAWAKTPSKVDSYRAYLAKLDKSDPDSMGKSVKEYQRLYAPKNDTKSQEASLDDWWGFSGKIFEQLGDAEAVGKISGLFDGSINNDVVFKALIHGKIQENDKAFEKAFGRKDTDFVEKVYRNGMFFNSTEGTAYVDYDPDFVEKSFSSYLGSAQKEYMHLRMKEMKEGFSDDAILQIPWDDVRQRIVAWDNYLKKYPDSSMNGDVKEEMNEYFRVYLSGMDNSDTCEGSPNGHSVLKADLRKSYETFIAKNKGCRYYGMVADYYRALKSKGFNCNEVHAADALRKYGLETMSAVQPMLR